MTSVVAKPKLQKGLGPALSKAEELEKIRSFTLQLMKDKDASIEFLQGGGFLTKSREFKKQYKSKP